MTKGVAYRRYYLENRERILENNRERGREYRERIRNATEEEKNAYREKEREKFHKRKETHNKAVFEELERIIEDPEWKIVYKKLATYPDVGVLSRKTMIILSALHRASPTEETKPQEKVENE
jgi:predicted metalloendopeptidase